MPGHWFDFFDESARRVLQNAQAEAVRLHHPHMGTEHLLLGLLHETENPGVKVLTSKGIDLEKARKQVESMIKSGDTTPAESLSVTPRAKQALEAAGEAAITRHHAFVRPEHILYGMLHIKTGMALGVLEPLGANLNQVETELVQILDRDNPQQIISRNPKHN